MAGASRSLVLFDGLCGFCDWSVRWLLDHDSEGRFHFAPLQGETASALRGEQPSIPGTPETTPETFVLVEGEGSEAVVYLRSRAVFRICRALPAPWRWIAVFRVVPWPLSDLAYRLFAAFRYRLFGTLDSCMVPPPEVRARFLP